MPVPPGGVIPGPARYPGGVIPGPARYPDGAGKRGRDRASAAFVTPYVQFSCEPVMGDGNVIRNGD
jgi:hypothetical protein